MYRVVQRSNRLFITFSVSVSGKAQLPFFLLWTFFSTVRGPNFGAAPEEGRLVDIILARSS